MNSTQPIAVFDLETTGLNVDSDNIVQIAIVQIAPDGTRQKWQTLVNPGRRIPAEAVKIHGIGDADVINAPRFVDIAHEVTQRIAGHVLAGYNITGFDLPFLYSEYERNQLQPPFDLSTPVIDCMAVINAQYPRTLAGALKIYTGKELENAHDAMADVEATAEIMLAQAKDGSDLVQLTNNGLELFDFGGRIVREPGGAWRWNFGKHNGEIVDKAKHNRYISWIVGADFPQQFKRRLLTEF